MFLADHPGYGSRLNCLENINHLIIGNEDDIFYLAGKKIARVKRKIA
jgi:hypothetical protein